MDNHKQGWELVASAFDSMGLPESAFMARQHGRIGEDESISAANSMFWSIVELEKRVVELESRAGIGDIAPRTVANSPELSSLQEDLDALQDDD